jgi:hypothetical protein
MSDYNPFTVRAFQTIIAMHLQQTKSESRATGGPQYYFHDLPVTIRDFLRRPGACPVILETPYGIVNTPFMAIGKDHKLTRQGEIVAGRVGHDRKRLCLSD